jgi:homoaconitase/3-isopropylmalate dehydratase large subunit
MTDIKLDRVFIGSCTNGRIEDLREVAKVVKDKKVSDTLSAMIVPGSGLGETAGRSRKVWTRFSSRPDLIGASRAVPCAWR